MNTIQASFNEYKQHVMPKSAGRIQIEETEQAFYSGAFIAMELLISVSDKYSEDQAMHIFEGISDEIKNFLVTKTKRRE